MTATELYARLKTVAPNVAFGAASKKDHYYVWDGDGPDPVDEGFYAHDVEVTATAVTEGAIQTGTAYMCGHYRKDDEPLDDLGGYLPQMLEEAANELVKLTPPDSHLRAELTNALSLLTQEMRDRYDAQRAEIEKERTEAV